MAAVKFRNNLAVSVAGLLAFFGAVPVATYRWYIAPALIVPLALMVWAWRAGTDADAKGVTIRALIGRRRLQWSEVDQVAVDGRRVVVTLAGGARAVLPAVRPDDLPRLMAASGRLAEAASAAG